MVYVPILKIELPEPRLEELIPGLVTVVVGACTLAFDAVYGLLHPLSPEGEQQMYEATLMSLPREFRKARRRVFELDIKDDDKIDEELDTAAYNFYRRRMREEAVGYSDEGPEDVTFRRLMTPASASRDMHGLMPLEVALLTQDTEALQQLTAGTSSQAAAAAAAAVAVLPPPGRARRATTTAAVGGAGLALGAGVVKLVHLISSRLAKQRRKAKRRAAAAAGQTGSRRGSEQGGAAAAAGGGRGSRRGSTGTTGTGRVTPRQR